MKKVGLIFVIILISACSSVRVTNLSPNTNSTVDVPLKGSLKSGWVLLNEYEISKYNYQNKELLSSVNYYPTRGYGDIFFVNEYIGVEDDEFYSGIVAYKIQSLANKKIINKNGSEVKIINWEYYKKDSEIIDLFDSAIKDVVKENDLSDELKDKVTNYFKNNSNYNISEIKGKADFTFDRLTSYPPLPIFNFKNREVRTFSVRKQFSSATVKTGYVYVPGEDAFSNASYLSLFPTVNFPVYENYALFLDSFSINMGVVNAGSNGSSSESFDSANKRYMVGLGYDIGNNFSFQTGGVFWDSGDNVKRSFYAGVSLDLLNFAALLSK